MVNGLYTSSNSMTHLQRKQERKLDQQLVQLGIPGLLNRNSQLLGKFLLYVQ